MTNILRFHLFLIVAILVLAISPQAIRADDNDGEDDWDDGGYSQEFDDDGDDDEYDDDWEGDVTFEGDEDDWNDNDLDDGSYSPGADDDLMQESDDDDDSGNAATVVFPAVSFDDDMYWFGDDGLWGNVLQTTTLPLAESDRPREDEVVLQLRQGIDPALFAERYGFDVLRVIAGPNIALFSMDSEREDDDELAFVLKDDDVLWGELNFSGQAPEGRPRYFFTSTNGTPILVDAAQLPAGLEFTPNTACFTGAGTIVAVLDTGVDANHPSLTRNVLPNGVNMLEVSFAYKDTGNSLDDDGDGQVDELVGHGTHVAGTILQIAPGALILPVTVLDSDGSGDAFSLAAGIIYAVEQGADVINLSLGSTHDSRSVRGAVEFALEQGAVLVAAVGNGDREEPAEYPARYEGVISVAATTEDSDKAEYSNFHTSVDISAPGNDVASSYPAGRYVTASGTSMAVPIVSGGIALMLEQDSSIDPVLVKNQLQATAGSLQLSNPAIDGKLGAGEVNIDNLTSCAN